MLRFILFVVIMVLSAVSPDRRRRLKSHRDFTRYPIAHYCEKFGLEHVMCKFRRPNTNCAPMSSYKSKATKETMDPIVNGFRNKYAASKFKQFRKGKYNYTIPDMNGLIWDDELFSLAKRWATQCPDNSTIYDVPQGNDVDRFHVAQTGSQLQVEEKDGTDYPKLNEFLELNFVWDHVNRPLLSKFHRAQPVNKKMQLTSYYDPRQPMTLFTNPHFKYYACCFTTMTYHAGSKDGNTKTYLRSVLVCNFGPLDLPYKQVQLKGPVCSQCPKGMGCLSKVYQNLCFDPLENPTGSNTTISTTLTSPMTTAPMTTPNMTTLPTDTTLESTSYFSKEELSTESLVETMTMPDTEDYERTQRENLRKNYSESDCFIACSNSINHIRCLYNGTSTDFEEVILVNSREVRESILLWHNTIRNVMAQGIQGFPQAGNMRELQWNPTLEESALLWAGQCTPYKYGCQDEYLTEGSELPTPVTQLVAPLIWQEEMGLPPYTRALNRWLLGIKHYNHEMLQKYTSPEEDGDYSSFVQLIWANSYMVGCGVALCHRRIGDARINHTDLEYFEDLEEGESLLMTVCNYAPGGLAVGKKVYEIGGPCTMCYRLHLNDTGGMYCSAEFINLCSDAIPVVSPFWKWIGASLIVAFLCK